MYPCCTGTCALALMASSTSILVRPATCATSLPSRYVAQHKRGAAGPQSTYTGLFYAALHSSTPLQLLRPCCMGCCACTVLHTHSIAHGHCTHGIAHASACTQASATSPSVPYSSIIRVNVATGAIEPVAIGESCTSQPYRDALKSQTLGGGLGAN